MQSLSERHDIPLWGYLSIGIDRLAGWLSWLLIGWWFSAPRAKRQQREFAREIRNALPFLFQEYGGEIVSNDRQPFPPLFAYTLVTVATRCMLLLFTRGRGEFSVLIASRRGERDWHDWRYLQDVLKVLDRPEDSESSLFETRNLTDVAHVLRAELPRLQEAISDEQWDLVKRKVNALCPLPLRIR